MPISRVVGLFTGVENKKTKRHMGSYIKWGENTKKLRIDNYV